MTIFMLLSYAVQFTASYNNFVHFTTCTCTVVLPVSSLLMLSFGKVTAKLVIKLASFYSSFNRSCWFEESRFLSTET